MKLINLFIYLVGALMISTANAELIVLAAPSSSDEYYADVVDDIFNFHVEFAKKIDGHDDVLILTDNSSYNRYASVLGKEKVVIAPMSDIWMRDFTTVNPELPVMFRYTAEGQGGGQKGQKHADLVQEELAIIAEDANIKFRESDLLNDGGNFVDDYAGNLVVSRKFLRDNNLTETKGRETLRKLTKAKNIAFIDADEQGGLEHADGVVSFVDTNTLLVNSYPEDPLYSQQLKADLKSGLPGIKIFEVITPYDGSQIYDDRFGSACGLYTNALVTPKRIYFPQFGIPEDKIAIEQVKLSTTREVIPVASHQVCQMGGGVRCMSWQLRPKAALLLKEYFQISY
ncbi:MAG: agmatine deiminase family protein [Magnetococcales bacterium]|nr:agmatine deiminase family protein [Magnetococcales bacterium]